LPGELSWSAAAFNRQRDAGDVAAGVAGQENQGRAEAWPSLPSSVRGRTVRSM
jgi:hypothetical protein